MSISKRIAVGAMTLVVGVFMLGGLAVVPAHAQTNAELEAQIQSLLATIAALQAQLDGAQTGGDAARPGCDNPFLRDLSVGATGQDVMDLQMFLNADASTRVAATGVGSPGQETMYYGALTADAVSRFQVKYAARVLAPLGLTSGTGYFGASSRDMVRTLCADATPTPTPGDGDDDDDEPADDDDLSGGEAEFEDFEVSNTPTNVDLSEGETDEVMAFNWEVEGGDMMVSRVEVAVENNSSGTIEDEPWRVFESVSLVVDGEVVATEDADSEGDWSEENSTASPAASEAYEMRFSGLDLVFEEGEDAEIFVQFTAQETIDSADLGETWTIWIPTDGVRAVDSLGINHYEGDGTSDTESFELEASDEADVTLSSSSEDPDSSVIVVEEDDESAEYTVFAFEIEAEDAAAFVEEMQIEANSSSSSVNSLINDLMIEIDGTTYHYDSIGSTTASTTDFTFDDLDFVIDEDEEVTVEVIAEFRQQDGNYAATGETITFSLGSDDDDLIVETEETGNAVDETGTVTGESHSIIVSGIAVEVVSTSESVSEIGTTGSEQGTFTIKFDVTAVEQDAYIATTTDESVSTGVEYDIIGQDNSGAAYSGTTTDNLTSTADVESGYFRVDEGSTETFTLKVVLNPTNSGFYGIELEEVYFRATVAGSDSVLTLPDTAAYETEEENITG